MYLRVEVFFQPRTQPIVRRTTDIVVRDVLNFIVHKIVNSSGRNALRSNLSSLVVMPTTEFISGNIERTHQLSPSSSLTLSETARTCPLLSFSVLMVTVFVLICILVPMFPLFENAKVNSNCIITCHCRSGHAVACIVPT